MRPVLRLCIGVASTLAACSLINKFDSLQDIQPDAGGGEAGTAGLAGGGAGGNGAGSGGKAGAGGEAGETGGTGGTPSMPITGGAIVIATRDSTGDSLVVLDPTDASQIARTQITTSSTDQIHALAYDAVLDKWFVFTGAPGKMGMGNLLVGNIDTGGFEQQATVTMAKPTDQIEVAVLNKRILYRNQVHTPSGQPIDDVLTLLDTSAMPPRAIGTMTVPYAHSLQTMVGSPAGGTIAGGRVFMLHNNSDVAANCMPEDGGIQSTECAFEYSAPQIRATDTGTLTPPSPTVIGYSDQSGSQQALAVQPGTNGSVAALVAPPLSSNNTMPNGSIYLFSAGTGVRTADPVLAFPLGTVTTTASISISGAAVDPCRSVAMTGELANAKKIYAVSLVAGGQSSSILPNSKNGVVGQLAYEPFSHTLIHSVQDPTTPTLEGYELHGMETAPTFVQRGKNGAAAWNPPAGINPVIVTVKMPTAPPCTNLP